MGTNHRKRRRNCIRQRNVTIKSKSILFDNCGDAVVEATIIFPIMTMIFAALVMLSIYLPSQAALQRATQYAATAVATEISDTWLFFDTGSMAYYRHNNKENLENVYAGLFAPTDHLQEKGEYITISLESQSISSKTGELSVQCFINNMIIYKEVTVSATREYPVPVDLSFVGFPQTITVTATSKSVVQNADEFIRNIDMATDFAAFIYDKFELSDVGDSIGSFGSEIKSLLGW